MIRRIASIYFLLLIIPAIYGSWWLYEMFNWTPLWVSDEDTPRYESFAASVRWGVVLFVILGLILVPGYLLQAFYVRINYRTFWMWSALYNGILFVVMALPFLSSGPPPGDVRGDTIVISVICLPLLGLMLSFICWKSQTDRNTHVDAR